jgi:hypothetical protein
MTAPILRFPLAAVLIFENRDGFLVGAPCGRWLCATLAGARNYANRLAGELQLPIRERVFRSGMVEAAP